MSSNVQPALRVVETREDWSPVRIRTLDISCRAAWDAFVDRQTDATFFHRAGWKDVIELAFDHTTHYLLAEQRGDIVGILPLVHVKSRLFGNTLSSLPFCVYGGVVAEENTVTTLFAAPQHPYTQQLLGSFPDVAHPDRPLRGIPGTPPRLDAMPVGCRFAPRCPFAFDRCHVERPPEYTAAGGRASCFLHDPAEAARA